MCRVGVVCYEPQDFICRSTFLLLLCDLFLSTRKHVCPSMNLSCMMLLDILSSETFIYLCIRHTKNLTWRLVCTLDRRAKQQQSTVNIVQELKNYIYNSVRSNKSVHEGHEGQRDPGSVHEGQRDPGSVHEGQRDPGSVHEGQRDPGSVHEGQRDPGSVHEGQRDPGLHNLSRYGR